MQPGKLSPPIAPPRRDTPTGDPMAGARPDGPGDIAGDSLSDANNGNAGQPTIQVNPRIEQVELVLEPATGATDATEALLLRRAAAGLLAAIGEVLQVPVSRATGHAEPPKGPAFAAAFTHPWLRGPALVAVDQPLARVLVDTVELMSAGLAGAGPITEAEVGLLDYLTLRVLDCAVRTVGGLPGAADPWRMRRLVLDETCDGHQAAAWLNRHPLLKAAAVPVSVGGREGTMSVFMPPIQREGVPLAELLSTHAARPEKTNTSHEVGVRVALPPVEMSAEVAERMEPGDVVVPGWGELDEAMRRGRLLSETGWVLCRAEVRSHSPTLVRVRLGEWSPTVWTDPAEERDKQNRVFWHPLVGGRPLRRDQLVRMRDGDELELPIEAAGVGGVGAQVVLVGRGRERWGGEWVRLDGEVGIRLVERVAREVVERASPQPRPVGLIDAASGGIGGSGGVSDAGSDDDSLLDGLEDAAAEAEAEGPIDGPADAGGEADDAGPR